jgi:YVTN family beta-propeller protein
MNRIKSTFATWIQSLPLRGEEGWVAPRSVMALMGILGLASLVTAQNATPPPIARTPSHSTTIALTPNERRIVVINREANSVSIIQVKDAQGNDIIPAVKLAEIGVGEEPRCVAVHPNAVEAYVTNGISGTVSVINIAQRRLVTTIENVGTEPRGCALTPTGALLYVANHTEGTVSIIDTSSRTVLERVNVERNPTALAITNNNNGSDADETVFVTQIFAELNPAFVDPNFGGNGEARDLGKRGVVQAFPVGNPNVTPVKITLAPLADSGFNADRTAFCTKPIPPQPHSLIFCPTGDVTQNPQGVFPNQLLSALIRGNRLFLPNIGAQPEPPETASTNVQALVNQVDTMALTEVGIGQNLNTQIAMETAAPPPSLDRTFANDIVAIDANRTGNKFVIVSRGGNQVLRAKLDPATGQLNILNDAGTRVDCRIQTGNLPSGVAMRRDGTRAYANNEANFSVTSMNIDNGLCLTLERDIDSAQPPDPGSFEHAVLVGKLAFFTALGIPDNDIFDTPIRNFVPRNFRGKMSADAWSSCGSCHPDGLADGVTWIFGTGPRQTIPLDGMFSKQSPDDQRVLNWSAVRGSNTDFNANSRATQGGCGFASAAINGFDPPDPCTNNNMLTPVNPAVYDHGITHGGSDALDAQTLWIFAAVRPLHQPQGNAAMRIAGQTVFATNCASCHGGAKWTKSEIFHRDNPAAVAQNGAPLDSGVTRLPVTTGGPLANEFKSFTCNNLTIDYLEDVGTFDVTNPIEIRDNATASTAFGVNGFQPPSLFSINYHAPYLHLGQAQTLDAVFPLHALNGGTIANLTAVEQANLLVFLKSIDGTTASLRSEGDEFRDFVRLQGTCPPPVP